MEPEMLLMALGLLLQTLQWCFEVQFLLLQWMDSVNSRDYMDILDDSSSILESGKNSLFQGLVFSIAIARIRRPSRMWWIAPRQHTQWHNLDNFDWIDLPMYEESQWLHNYRMKRHSFEKLVELLCPYILKPGQKVRKPVEPRRAVAMVIYYLAHGELASHVGQRFHAGASTVSKYIRLVTDALASNKKLFHRFVNIPNGVRLASIIADFKEATGLPNVFGVVDGSHINLYRKPRKNFRPHDYRGRHKRHSVLLQGICSFDKQFLHVCVIRPGVVHDAGHFRQSSIYKLLIRKKVLQEPKVNLIGHKLHKGNMTDQLIKVAIPPQLLGDSAYPSRRFLLKIMAEKNAKYARFNKKICKGRVVIENTFGMLKEKWRALKALGVKLSDASRVIHACCALHNYCIMERQDEDLLPLKPVLPSAEYQESLADSKRYKRAGDQIRSIIFENI